MAHKSLGGTARTNPTRLNASLRHIEALKLRAAGMQYQDIADALGYADKSSAYCAVMGALKKARQEPADQMRKLENERLDGLWREAYAQANDVALVAEDRLKAIDRCVKVMERRAKLLGLDAPAKQELSGPAGAPLHLEHSIDGDTAESIFDILAAAGAIPAGGDEAAPDGVHPAQPDA
jgi:hypothetical protein